MTPYNVAPWVAISVIALEIGRAFIGFPGWFRTRLQRSRSVIATPLRCQLILDRTLNRVDDDDVHGRALRLQLQTELFLERNE